MRQALHVDLGDARLIGTGHIPIEAPAPSSDLPAVLLLNFGDMYRAGPSDLSAHLADELCEAGYATFRFDMPGLGDSEGDLPPHQETYWRFVQQGGQVKWVCRLIDELQRRYGCRRFVLGGLCGGAVTATLVAQRLGRRVAGLILLEPSVDLTAPLPHEEMPGQKHSPLKQAHMQAQAAVKLVRKRLRRLPLFTTMILRYRALRHATAPTGKPAAKAPPLNWPLVRGWQSLAEARLPMLVLLAPGPSRQLIQSLFSPAQQQRMNFVLAEHTGHLLNTGDGPRTVYDESRDWLESQFQTTGPSPAVRQPLPSAA